MNSANGGNIIYKFIGDTSNLDKATSKTSGILKGLGAATGVMASGIVAASATATAALIGITKESVQAYAEMEQLAGGAKKIFDEMDYSKIENDAKQAYKTMNLSASQYLALINDVGATFAATMGDEKGYNAAKQGLQAISDYASGTGKNVDLLGQKFTMITRSTASYQSIADQFSGVLPATSQAFLEQAQAAGLLSQEYQKLTDVPIDEYQQAVSEMLTKGVADLGLANNTAAESVGTVTGSIAAAKAAFQNFLSGAGGFEEVVDTVVTAGTQIGKAVVKMLPKIVDGIVGIVNGLIPELPKLIETLLPTLLNGVISLIQGLTQALPSLLTTLAQMLPTIVQSLVDMFVQVSKAFAEQAPTIMPIVVNGIIDALITLLENIDVLIDATLALVLGLYQGIIQCLPILIERLPEIVQKILEALIEAAPVLIKAGIELIIMIVKGTVQAIPTLIKSLWTLSTQTIPNAIREAIPKAIQAGKDMIKGLWNGIKNFDLKGNMKKLASQALDGFTSMLGIHSPSTAFAYLGKMSMLGYTNQIEDMKGMLDDVIQSTFSISPELTTGGLHYSPNVIVNNNISSNTDPLGQTVTNIKTFANGAKNDYNYGMGV